MTPVNRYAALFDLDGTLIDSVRDLAAAVNKDLVSSGLEPLAIDDVRGMVGNGLSKLVQRAYRKRDVDLDDVRLAARSAAVLGHYEADLYSQTELLAGARDAITTFSQAGASIAIVTNKPQNASELILSHFGLSESIDLVVGGDLDIARKPAPDMILHALRTVGVKAANALMIGDSPADAKAAASAGVRCVIVRGGYNAPKSAFQLTDLDQVIDDLTVLKPEILFGENR